MKRIFILIFFLVFSQAALAAPERIVSINLCTDELLPLLAAESSIAALTVFSDANPDLVYENIPKIRGEAEEILALDPDLVVGGTFSNRETIAILKRLKIPVTILEVADGFDMIYENIRILAAALGTEERADILISTMQAELKKIKVERREAAPAAVFYQRNGNVPGRGTFQHSILELAGLENLAARLGISGHGYMSLEELVLNKPDILILTDSRKEHYSIGNELLFHPALKKGLPDVKVIHLPGYLLECGSPYAVQAASLLKDNLKALK